MKILDIYEFPPNSYNKKNYNIVWSSRLSKENKNYLSVYSLINKKSMKLKIDVNNFYKNFFLKNKIYFFPFFNLNKDFSYLVLSNFVEKNPYKINFNLHLLKCLAFKDFLKSHKFNQVNIRSSNKKFLSLIHNLLGTDYKSKKIFDLIYNYLKLSKFFLKNLIKFIIFILKNINFNHKAKSKINKNPIFFSFFSYTDKQKAILSKYHSEYWKGFANTDNKNWVHLYDFSLNYKTSQKARKLIQILNFNKQKRNHFFFDDYLNIKIFIVTIFVSIKFFFFTSRLVFSKNFNLLLKKELYLNSENHLNFYKEFISYNTMRNILYFYQFNNFFLSNKIKSNIFFTLENQPWEKILLYFAKKNKFIKKTYGVIHSSVRFWDLRFVNFVNNKKPILGYINPDKILFNSFFVKKILLQNGYKKNCLQSSESLRYLNFDKFLKNNKTIKKNKKKINLLIITDYDDDQNKSLLEIIRSFRLNNKYFLYLKNHPLKKLEIKQNNLKIINKIDYLKNKIDLAIIGNKTAASLDLYYKNYNILIHLDSDNLDYSPLHKFIDYKTFSSIDELNELLNIYSSKLKYPIPKNIKKKYFITNKKLLGWKKILSI